jgi:hypothetical protein
MRTEPAGGLKTPEAEPKVWSPMPADASPEERLFVDAARLLTDTDPDGWFSLADIANKAGGEHETLRKASTKLQKLGLLKKRDAGNGFRASRN